MLPFIVSEPAQNGCEKFNLYSCERITDAGLKNLSQCNRLREIDLSFCDQVTDQGVEALALNCPNLTSVILHSTSISDRALICLGKMSSRLEELSVSYCKDISDHGINAIARNCKNLMHLHAARCSNLTDLAIDALARFNPKLRTLEVTGCVLLSDSAFHSLAQACHYLERIDLEECHLLTNSSLYHFSIHCSFIKDLSLSHCENVTDEGIGQLCEGELRQTLESIDLDNCPLLSDAALRSLSNCPKLRNIELIDCLQITKPGIDALKKKLPDVEVYVFFAPESPPTVDADNQARRRRFFKCPTFRCNIL